MNRKHFIIKKYRFLIGVFFLLFFVSLFGADVQGTDKIRNRLNDIDEKISTAVLDWQISTGGSSWKAHSPGTPVVSEKFKLRTVIKGVPIFSGFGVSGTPIFISLEMQAKGFCMVNIIVNGGYLLTFNIEGSSGIRRDLTKDIMISGSAGIDDYEVVVEVINQGFDPPRKEYRPPRQKKLKEEGIYFRVKSAEFAYPDALDIYEEIKDWLTSMRTADALLDPGLRQSTLPGKPARIENKKNISPKRLRALNSLLHKSVFAVDLDALNKGDTDRLKESLQRSYKIAGKLSRFAKEFKVFVTGYTRGDAACLRRINESESAARNTGDIVILNMEEFPEFHYAQGQALTYEWIEKKYPGLFEKIKDRVRQGKWALVGGTYVEPDGDLISGESWVRQLLYGKNYFKEKFGIDVKTGWHMHPGGSNRNLPQIYMKSGIKRLVTQQLARNDSNVFPYDIFRWQGVDGTRLLSIVPLSDRERGSCLRRPFGESLFEKSSAKTFHEPINKSFDRTFSKVRPPGGTHHGVTLEAKKSLVLYGSSDNSFGTFQQVLKQLDDYKKLFISPEIIHAAPQTFLDNIANGLGKNSPVWNDELYLENHRGTYTTRGRIKKNNRRSESRISTAEKLASAAAFMGFTYPRQELEDAWKLILTNQSLPVLSGASYAPVYRDAMEFYKRAAGKIKKVENNALAHIAQKINTALIKEGTPLFVFNPLSWRRSDFVTVDYPAAHGGDVKLLNIDGNEVPVEIKDDRENGRLTISFIAENIPAVGYKLYSIVEAVQERAAAPLAEQRTGTGRAVKARRALPTSSRNLRKKTRNLRVSAQGHTLENKFYKIKIDANTGNIKRLFDKVLNREFVAEGKQANVLQVYEDRPEKWDARNIGYTGRVWELDRADSIDIVTESPVRAVLRVKKSFLGLSKTRVRPTEHYPSSFFTQYITLYRDLDRVDIETEADWWEEHMFLKAAFPVNVNSDNAAYEIPFAAIDRPAKSETPWEQARFEVPALRWADLSEGEFGISLLNDSKYGYDIHGNVMKISLLRSPVWPDPLTDRGKHTFVYSLYTHKGRWHEAETVKRGHELNAPLVILLVDRHEGELPGEASFFSLDAQGVILDTVKKAEKGSGFILRLYEANGKDEKVTLRLFKEPVQVYETGLMENKIKEIKCRGNFLTLSFKKYEIKTLLVYY